MCVVSMVSDHYMQRLGQVYQGVPPSGTTFSYPSPVTRDEFEALRKEVLEMKELLKKAKAYDERTGQPDCHMDAKVTMLKKIAEIVGVSLDDLFLKS